MQVEAAQHLDQPLVLQGLGNQDQHPLGTAREQLLIDDHPGFYGLAQTDFIGQQNARGMTMSYLAGDVQLVRDQADATTGQTAGRAAAAGMLMDQRLVAQAEPREAVDLPGEQAILWLVEFEEVA